MDPSALIFVGLAVAWLAYLVPKALEHHEAGERSRSVSTFSHKLRVLARREPVDSGTTRLVTTSAPAEARTEGRAEGRPEGRTAGPSETTAETRSVTGRLEVEVEIEQTGFFAAQRFVRRSAASRAVRRRRRVLMGILVLIAMVAAAAVGQVISFWWLAAPVALLVAWLVACRLMVKQEHVARRAAPRPAAARSTQRPPVETADVAAGRAEEDREDAVVAADVARDMDETAEVPVVRADLAEPVGDGWELVPVTLPTYVSKPAARRTVSSIDLESTGVWTSGRTAADSALAQQVDAVRTPDAETPATERRVSGA